MKITVQRDLSEEAFMKVFFSILLSTAASIFANLYTEYKMVCFIYNAAKAHWKHWPITGIKPDLNAKVTCKIISSFRVPSTPFYSVAFTCEDISSANLCQIWFGFLPTVIRQIFHRSAGGVSGSLLQAQVRSQPLLGSTQVDSLYSDIISFYC